VNNFYEPRKTRNNFFVATFAKYYRKLPSCLRQIPCCKISLACRRYASGSGSPSWRSSCGRRYVHSCSPDAFLSKCYSPAANACGPLNYSVHGYCSGRWGYWKSKRDGWFWLQHLPCHFRSRQYSPLLSRRIRPAASSHTEGRDLSLSTIMMLLRQAGTTGPLAYKPSNNRVKGSFGNSSLRRFIKRRIFASRGSGIRDNFFKSPGSSWLITLSCCSVAA